MSTLIFMGRVLPEVRAVTLPQMAPIKLTEPDGFVATFAIAIKDGKIVVTCSAPSESDDDFNRCWVRARGFCTTMLDVLSFSTGWSLQALLEVGVCKGEARPLAMSEQSVAPLCTAFSLEAGFEEVVQIVTSKVELSFALHDLAAGIGTQNYSAIAAGRAVEAIRHLIAPDAKDTPEAWGVMREKLNLDRAYLQVVTDASLDPRHGKRGNTSGALQLDVTHRAWAIMDRYIIFLRCGGENALAKEAFPLLS